MKRILFTISCLFTLMCYNGFAQLLLNENFAYNAGDTLTTKGWTVTAPSTTNIVKAVAPGLAFSGYSSSAIGNAAFITNTGQDIYKDGASSVSSGSVYYSFMLNDSVAGTGDYFMALLPATSTTNYFARAYIKAASTGYYRIGISKASTTSAETTVYSTDSFVLHTTYLCVVKYQFNTGTTNDSVKLYVFSSSLPATEPAVADAATIGGTNTDATDLGRIALRQGTAGSSPILTIDGIHIASRWNALNTTVVNPLPVSGITYSGITPSSTTISWVKPSGYDNATMTTLLFVKPGSITQGTPTLAPGAYTPNSNYSLTTSGYQNDSLARHVFQGDTNTVTITGLNSTTTYYVLAYVVRDVDSVYSSAPSVNTKWGTANAGPKPVTVLTFTANGQNAGTLRWTKDTSYKNTLHTTVVFLKQGLPVTVGTPTISPSRINDNAAFMSGSMYQNDSNAYSVYKGDTNMIAVTGLTTGTTYYAIAYTVNDADSLYSTVASGSGSTLAAAPNAVSGTTFTGTGTTTAKIAWTKPGGYSNSAYSTLVFVKPTTPVIAGTPTKTTSSYSASTFFGFGSRYQNDTAARCVFKGDTNYVNISNIYNTTSWHVLVYVVRDVDSTYSGSDTASGLASPNPPPPPYYTIGQITKQNSTTGNPDSLNVRAGVRGVVYGFEQATGGHRFVVRDNTGGITVASNSGFGYTVSEGDSIRVEGSVSTSRGLVTLNATASFDTIKRLGLSTQVIKPLIAVYRLNEQTENDLIRLDSVTMGTTTDTVWRARTYLIFSRNNDSMNLRVYSLSGVVGQPIPKPGKRFHVIGLGAQNSSSFSAPFAFDGYYIIPRVTTDIILLDSVIIGVAENAQAPVLSLYPNPANGVVTIAADQRITRASITDISGRAIQVLSPETNTLIVDAGTMPKGVYFIKVETGNGQAIRKLLVQ